MYDKIDYQTYQSCRNKFWYILVIRRPGTLFMWPPTYDNWSANHLQILYIDERHVNQHWWRICFKARAERKTSAVECRGWFFFQSGSEHSNALCCYLSRSIRKWCSHPVLFISHCCWTEKKWFVQDQQTWSCSLSLLSLIRQTDSQDSHHGGHCR